MRIKEKPETERKALKQLCCNQVAYGSKKTSSRNSRQQSYHIQKRKKSLKQQYLLNWIKLRGLFVGQYKLFEGQERGARLLGPMGKGCDRNSRLKVYAHL